MRVAIYGQFYQNSTEPIIRDIFAFFNQNGIEIAIGRDFLAELHEKGIIRGSYPTFATTDDLREGYDLFVSIGGDGTILRSAALVGDTNIPIVGVNAGRLGFLANVQKDSIASFFRMILERQYTVSKRTLLSVSCSPEVASICDLNFAMNEVSVSRKDTASMITIETYLNGEFLNSYWADGLIIATPTGSTGYNLSCGGPILTPDVNSLVITPISPHNLNARPLVIPDSTEIRLRVTGREENYHVSLDSRIASVSSETVLTIARTPFCINMIELSGQSFLKTLRTKLLWGEDRRN